LRRKGSKYGTTIAIFSEYSMAEIKQERDVRPAGNNSISQRQNVEFAPDVASADVVGQPRAGTADEIPPNPTVIIKNLPYDLDLIELEQKLNELNNGQLQYKNYCPHKDSNGNFRGMVFINYRNLSDAEKAYKALSELEIGGRKARIEYRRLKPGEKPPRDEPEKPARAPKPRRSSEANWRLMRSIVPAEEPVAVEDLVEEENSEPTSTRKQKREPKKTASYVTNVTKYTNDLKDFMERDDSEGTEFVFPADLTSFQRCAAHEAAQNLGLPHKTFEYDENGRNVHVIKDPDGEFLGEKAHAEKRAFRPSQRKKEPEEFTAEEMSGFEQKLIDFKNRPDSEGLDLEFDSFLSFAQRKFIHKVADELGLGHKVVVKDDARVLTCTKDPEKTALWKEEWSQREASFAEKKREEAAGDGNGEPDTGKAGRRRNKRATADEQDKDKKPAYTPLTPEEAAKYRWTKPRSMQKDGNGESITVQRYIPRYTPPRQPRGPDGTRGFHSRAPTVDAPPSDSVNENEAATPSEQPTSDNPGSGTESAPAAKTEEVNAVSTAQE